METITTSDAAILLGASSRTVNRLIVAGTIPAVQLGDDKGWYRIQRSDIEAYASRRGITLDWSLLDKQTA